MRSFRDKGGSVLIILCLLLSMGSIVSVNSSITYNQSSPSGSGSVNGVDYSYGVDTYTETGNYQLNVSGSIFELTQKQRTVVRDMNLIKDFQINDILFEVERKTYNQLLSGVEENRTVTEYYNQNDYINTYLASIQALEADADPLTNASIIEEYRVTEAPVLEGANFDDGKFVGQFPVNISRVDYNATSEGQIYRGIDIVTPVGILMTLQTDTVQVAATTTNVELAAISYFNQYTLNYSLAAEAFRVNLTDGENFGAAFTMFNDIEANYTESFVSVLQYNFVQFQATDVEFANAAGDGGNGTKVYDNANFNYTIPLDLLPKRLTSNGTSIEAGYRQVQSTLKTTFQNVAAAFQTRATDQSSNFLDQTQIESSLTAWSISTSNNLIAFQDNGDASLGLGINDEGLRIKDDVVKYVGLTESYSRDEYNAYYTTTEKNESATFYGLGVDVTNNNQNETSFVDHFSHVELGDTNAAGSPTYYFEQPSVDANGIVTFEFGANYTDFPVSWVNLQTGQVTTDTSDLGYNYVVTVDPETGRADIATTWYYSGVQDATLKSRLSGYSLSTFVKSEFFTADLVYTATPTNATLNSSRTSEFSNLNVNIAGSGDTAVDVDVTDEKQFYTSNGVTHTASFSALNIVQVSGQFNAEAVSVFDSESENLGSASNEAGLVEKLEVDYFYSADLLIITYPEWEGNDITHDPEFGISYKQRSQDNMDEEEPTDEDEQPELNSESPTDGDDEPGSLLPGFELIFASSALLAVTAILRRKKN